MEIITIPVDPEIKNTFEKATPETLQKLTIRENSDETEEDWGLAEHNAYLRMNESSKQNISSEVFLDWLSELEKGENFSKNKV